MCLTQGEKESLDDIIENAGGSRQLDASISVQPGQTFILGHSGPNQY